MAELSPRIRARLEKIPAVAVEAASAEMEKIAGEIVGKMKATAPSKYGRLRESIAWTWGDAPAGTLVIDEIRSGSNKGDQYATIRLTIYVSAFYARWVEFGTAPHSVAKGASLERHKKQDEAPFHPGATAHPFFYPVWKAEKAKARRRIAAAVRAAVRKEWAR